MSLTGFRREFPLLKGRGMRVAPAQAAGRATVYDMGERRKRTGYYIGLSLAACTALSGCTPIETCSNKVVKALPSPNGKQTLWLYVRDCGATTGYSTHIALLDGNTPPTEGGNIAVADDNHGVVKTDQSNHQLLGTDVRWVGSKGVAITFPIGARTFKMEHQLGDITISYDEVRLQ